MNPIALQALQRARARRDAEQPAPPPPVIHKSQGHSFEEVAPPHPVDALVERAEAVGIAIDPRTIEIGRAICDAPVPVPDVPINRDLKNEGRRGALDIARGMAATVGITCTKADIIQRIRDAAEHKPPSQAAGFREIADELEKTP